MKTVVFTGGGTAGHVIPNLALISQIKRNGAEVYYIGSYTGIEKEMIGHAGVEYFAISSGKLRRYFSLKNFSDPFKILNGYIQARKVLKKLKPGAVFSKGGFVTVPVVYAAESLGIPVILHESDYTPGLANKLSAPRAQKICVSFEDTLKYTGEKGIYTGTPLRSELFAGDKKRGFAHLGFSGKKPVLLIMGGSLGAVAINNAVEQNLDRLCEIFDIAHIRGADHINQNIKKTSYRQFEFIDDALPDVFAAADIMLSRSGANAVFEILALKIPALLIPLPLNASRGDQILNAQYCEKRGFSHVLPQEDMENLYSALLDLYSKRSELIKNMSEHNLSDATKTISDLILEYIK